jgi:putative transposase
MKAHLTQDFPSLEEARTQEGERRLMLLGPFAEPGHKYDRFEMAARARLVMVPRAVFQSWYDIYHAKGLEGLKQDLKELSESMMEAALQRLAWLGPLAMSEYVSVADLSQVAGQLPAATNDGQGDSSQPEEGGDWSVYSRERWMRRFRKSGLWGLTTLSNSALEQGAPVKEKSAKRPKRDLGALDEYDLEEMFRHRARLGDLADKKRVTRQEAQAQAASVGISTSTFWNDLRAYREDGLRGLARAARSDKGKFHIISDDMVSIVQGIRLSLADIPETRVHEIACEKAAALGEIEPTASQVRSICAAIEEPLKLLSKGHNDQFRNKYQITYPIIFEGVVYQIDIKDQVPVLLLDKRAPKYRTRTGEFRPYLITCLESNSGAVVARRFTYDYPDRFDIAAVLRDAFRVTGKKPCGGLPKEIWVDNGKQLIARHVQNFCKEKDVILHRCRCGNPKEKGRVERFFKTLETRLWSELDGYVGPNLQGRNPKAKAKLTLKQLVAKFDEFIEKYHAEVHSKTGQTPPDYFYEHCYAPPVDDRELDMLLKEKLPRVVLKQGISYDNRVFWHPELALIVGQQVEIRADAPYAFSDEIEVFYEGEWLCTAIDQASEAGRAVTPAVVGAAQTAQYRYLRGTIKEAREALKAADRDIEAKAKSESVQAPIPPTLTEVAAAPDVAGGLVNGVDEGETSENEATGNASADIRSIPEAPDRATVARGGGRQSKTSPTLAKPAKPQEDMTYLERVAARLASANEEG